MSLTQLNPPLRLHTPAGPGLCHFVVDHGPEHNLLWVVFDDATGQVWTWDNTRVRAGQNITWGRPCPQKPRRLDAVDRVQAYARGAATDGPGRVQRAGTGPRTEAAAAGEP